MARGQSEVALSDLRVYANFSVDTAPKHREKLAELCHSTPGILFEKPEVSLAGRAKYLQEMRDSGLVVCPRGNGLDTHRFYEALYVGAIPIVLLTSYSARLARYFDLPFIGLPRWESLTAISTILELAGKVRSRSVSLDSITMTWWLKELEL